MTRSRVAVRAFAASLFLVAACGSDDSSPGGGAAADGGGATDAGALADGAVVTDAGVVADAAAATEGMVATQGFFGDVDLSGLSNALSETTSVAQGTELQVVLAALASCGDVTNGPTAGATFLELSLYTATAATVDGGDRPRTAATAPGTYDLDLTTAGPYADAYVIPFDSSCHATFESGKITSGTVTVSAVSAAGVVGTFDLTSSAGSLTGSFSTVPCTGAYDLVAPTSTADCHGA
jgi:hypothetical protein